jgi:hypothetical protein
VSYGWCSRDRPQRRSGGTIIRRCECRLFLGREVMLGEAAVPADVSLLAGSGRAVFAARLAAAGAALAPFALAFLAGAVDTRAVLGLAAALPGMVAMGPIGVTVSSCRLQTTQAATPRRRSCQRGQAPRLTWPRSPSGSGAA